MAKLNIGVIAGRHEMPAEEYIFKGPIKDPTDVDTIQKMVWDFVNEHPNLSEYDVIHLYVTGLTVAVIECLRVIACALQNTDTHLVLKHYNLSTNTYYDQVWF